MLEINIMEFPEELLDQIEYKLFDFGPTAGIGTFELSYFRNKEFSISGFKALITDINSSIKYRNHLKIHTYHEMETARQIYSIIIDNFLKATNPSILFHKISINSKSPNTFSSFNEMNTEFNILYNNLKMKNYENLVYSQIENIHVMSKMGNNINNLFLRVQLENTSINWILEITFGIKFYGMEFIMIKNKH